MYSSNNGTNVIHRGSRAHKHTERRGIRMNTGEVGHMNTGEVGQMSTRSAGAYEAETRRHGRNMGPTDTVTHQPGAQTHLC